jgi:hypothetical protein
MLRQLFSPFFSFLSSNFLGKFLILLLLDLRVLDAIRYISHPWEIRGDIVRVYISVHMAT